MVNCWTCEVAVHVELRRGLVGVNIAGEDDVPFVVEVVNFWSPEIIAIGSVFRGRESKFDVRIVPVARLISRVTVCSSW